MLTNLYGVWQWVVAISAVISVVSVLIAFWRYINRESSQHKAARFLGNIIAIVALATVCVSCIIGMVFTEVPRVHGVNVDEADIRLHAAGLEIALEPGVVLNENLSEDVIGQSIDEGSIVPKGTQVIVYLKEEQTDVPAIQGTVTVPQVAGMEQSEGIEILTERGLQFQVWWTEENNADTELFYIIDQSIPAGSEVAAGTLIKLELSPDRP